LDGSCTSQVAPRQIESQITKVPRALFKSSPVFQSMFTISQPPESPPDGSDDDHPLKLKHVSIYQFEPFLKVAVAQ
jgi:hypothetical protein